MSNHINKKLNNIKDNIKIAFPHTIPVLAGFLVLGIGYGILMQSKGYSVLWSVLMSAIAFCGSMQFVAVTLLTIAFNPIQAFFMSLMVNARHLFYGLSLLKKYKSVGKVKYFLIYTLCDETFSITSSVNPPDGIDKKSFYFYISFLDYIYWIVGTFLGGVIGGLITFNTAGLDFVLTALFIVLFMEQMKNKENYFFGFVGIISSILAIIIFGSSNMVIPSMIIILSILLLWRKQSCH